MRVCRTLQRRRLVGITLVQLTALVSYMDADEASIFAALYTVMYL